MHLLRITWFRTGCCGLSRFVQCLNIDLQFAPKYVRILVCRLHLFWGAGSFPRAKLEETRTSRNRWCPRTNIRAYLRAKWRLNGVYHPSYVSAARKTECDKWLTVKTFTANDLFLQFPCFWTKRRSLLYWASSLTILPYHQLKVLNIELGFFLWVITDFSFLLFLSCYHQFNCPCIYTYVTSCKLHKLWYSM